MSNNKEELSIELIIATKEAVEASTGLNFGKLFVSYQEKNNDQPELTEVDFVAEILESGGYQRGENASFEDIIMIGALAMCEDLELLN
jgi:hypothetical protein